MRSAAIFQRLRSPSDPIARITRRFRNYRKARHGARCVRSSRAPSDNCTSERAEWLLVAARWFLDHGSYIDLYYDLYKPTQIGPRIGDFRYFLMRVSYTSPAAEFGRS